MSRLMILTLLALVVVVSPTSTPQPLPCPTPVKAFVNGKPAEQMIPNPPDYYISGNRTMVIKGRVAGDLRGGLDSRFGDGDCHGAAGGRINHVNVAGKLGVAGLELRPMGKMDVIVVDEGLGNSDE